MAKKLKHVWLIELDGVPHAIFDSFRAASSYTRNRRNENLSLVVTTTKILAFLKEDSDAAE